MRILAFLLLVTSSFASEKESTFGVGNGGSGILKNGTVYLRDLFWSGPEHNNAPWLGEAPHRYERFLLTSLSDDSFRSVKPLVSRKLHDLEEAEPGLGFLIGQAIKKMNWILVNDSLRHTCDTADDIFDPKDGMKAVQIANRYQQEVWIDRELWGKMSDAHRAALIIHEGIYSLAPEEDRQLDCRAPMKATRKFVSHAFTPALASEGVKGEALSYFNVGGLSAYFGIFDKISGGKFYHALEFSYGRRSGLERMPIEENSVPLRETLGNACRELGEPGDWPTDLRFGVTRPPFYLIPRNDGFEVALQRVTIADVIGSWLAPPAWQTMDQCVSSLEESVKPWLQGIRGIDPASSPGPGNGPKNHRNNQSCDPSKYLEFRPDVAANPYYAERPVLHYLDRGAAQGMCNPGYHGDFSQCAEEEYLKRRPDVAAHEYFRRRVKEHFVSHGVKEGMCDPR